MSEPTCSICGEPSVGKYCSERCKWTSSNKKRYKRPPRSCPGCGLDLTDRHGQVKYCSNACRHWSNRHPGVLRSPAAECAQCSGRMTGKMATAIYCGRKCKNAATEQRRVRDDRSRYIKERERRIRYAVDYARLNPEVGQAAKRKRKSLLVDAGVFEVSGKSWSREVRRHGGLCFYCGNPGATMDHILPISRGGTHSIGNLVPACAGCNSSKRHRTIMEWRLGKRVPLAA